jgi:hypothetical protein
MGALDITRERSTTTGASIWGGDIYHPHPPVFLKVFQLFFASRSGQFNWYAEFCNSLNRFFYND